MRFTDDEFRVELANQASARVMGWRRRQGVPTERWQNRVRMDDGENVDTRGNKWKTSGPPHERDKDYSYLNLPSLANIHPDAPVVWDRDIGRRFDVAIGFLVNTGEADFFVGHPPATRANGSRPAWERRHSLCRVHGIDRHGYAYLVFAFSDRPTSHWWLAREGYARYAL